MDRERNCVEREIVRRIMQERCKVLWQRREHIGNIRGQLKTID